MRIGGPQLKYPHIYIFKENLMSLQCFIACEKDRNHW